MKRTHPLAIVLVLTIAVAAGSMRLWWLHASRMQQRYILDYCRFTLGMPSFPFWPYRIQAVQHLAPSVLQNAVFGGLPLHQVLLWPLIATAFAAIAGVFIAAWASGPSGKQDRLLQGAPIISHRRWNWPLLFRRRERGFYIDTK